MRLEIGHQEGCRDSFAANIADHQPKLIPAELEKIVVIATYVAGLDANGCVFNAPDAPVSYPFLWDIPQHDYVQWNGIGANSGVKSQTTSVSRIR